MVEEAWAANVGVYVGFLKSAAGSTCCCFPSSCQRREIWQWPFTCKNYRLSTEKGWKNVPLGNLNLFPNLNPTEPELSEEINLFQVLLFQKFVFNLLLNYYTHTVKAKTLSIVQFVTFFQGGVNYQFDWGSWLQEWPNKMNISWILRNWLLHCTKFQRAL